MEKKLTILCFEKDPKIFTREVLLNKDFKREDLYLFLNKREHCLRKCINLRSLKTDIYSEEIKCLNDCIKLLL